MGSGRQPMSACSGTSAGEARALASITPYAPSDIVASAHRIALAAWRHRPHPPAYEFYPELGQRDPPRR